ncbi:two-component system response regulator [Aquabacterium sp. OR-4]|uniref:two-component system response regulator n=1 Tax=Aquabacterium sp. OR-4 TaxID=2978127 RepID=UPI0028C64254|nr:two-component system response regulator [Aquabacterium sp. OR-4]MDT7834675.1 two-component system response regulator [Aquabacterium sp. OR-4]
MNFEPLARLLPDAAAGPARAAPGPLPTDVAVPRTAPARVLVVDDTPANLSLLANLLNQTYRVQLATSGAKALELARRTPPDLIVLDVMMPEMDGYEVCRQLKADARTRHVPVLFLTALSRPEDESRGFEVGGADFIHKPFNPATVLARVATQLQAKAWQDAMADRNRWLQQALQERLAEVDQLRDATLYVMVSFAEFRDEETGNHVRRTQEYVRALAQWLADQGTDGYLLDAEQIDQLAKSAPLHDIGKVAIPDGILLKPARLTPEEFTIMKSHAVRGWELLNRAAEHMGQAGSLFLAYAMQIARHHHEHWNGGGYPDGLSGVAIPLSARLMAVADVYDALISRRPYKEPMPHAEALSRIRQGAGQQFDPQVVLALEAVGPQLESIARQWHD